MDFHSSVAFSLIKSNMKNIKVEYGGAPSHSLRNSILHVAFIPCHSLLSMTITVAFRETVLGDRGELVRCPLETRVHLKKSRNTQPFNLSVFYNSAWLSSSDFLLSPSGGPRKNRFTSQESETLKVYRVSCFSFKIHINELFVLNGLLRLKPFSPSCFCQSWQTSN